MAEHQFISAEWMRSHASERGGWNRKQLAAIGVPWPLTSGWMSRTIGRQITPEQAADFQRLRTDKAARLAAALPPEQSGQRLIEQRDRKATKKEQRKAKRAAKVAARQARADARAAAKPKVVPRSPGYAGDVTADDFLSSYAWRQLRMRVLKHYGARCMCCGVSPADGATMNVDHIKPRRLFPALALDFDNLQVLCGECNHGKGNWDQTDWRAALTAAPVGPDWTAVADRESAQHLRAIIGGG